MLPLLPLLPLLLGSLGASEAAAALANLTVDYVPASAAIVEGQSPLFRWVIPAAAVRSPGVVQSSYRLQLRREDSPPGAAAAAAAFDSGVVTTAATAALYGGAPQLLPDAHYSFSVQVVLSDGTALSGVAQFRTGLQSTQRAAWSGAEWIAGESTVPIATADRRNNLRSAVWTLDDAPSSATAFVAGIGYHELYCNGVRQGLSAAKLQPGFTNFEKRTYYVLYSLTDCLKKGANVLAVELGSGWYSAGVAGSKHATGGSGMPHARTSPPQLLLRARATVGANDSLLVSGSAWQAAPGPIIEDSLYNGEIFDARRELKDPSNGRHFSHPDYNATRTGASSSSVSRGNATAAVTWTPVVLSTAMPSTTKLVPQLMPPIQKVRALPAKNISQPAPGIHVIDFGQNTAAIVRMKLPRGMAAGHNVTIYHAELLNHPPYTPPSKEGPQWVYMDNLRHGTYEYETFDPFAPFVYCVAYLCMKCTRHSTRS
jgi:alpha-L-rhamnosidase